MRIERKFALGVALSGAVLGGWASGARASVHASYDCVLASGSRTLARGEFVSNKTLVLTADGARFQIGEVGVMDAGPETASTYTLELRVGDASAVTMVAASEPHPYLQLTRDGKQIDVSCFTK